MVYELHLCPHQQFPKGRLPFRPVRCELGNMATIGILHIIVDSSAHAIGSFHQIIHSPLTLGRIQSWPPRASVATSHYVRVLHKTCSESIGVLTRQFPILSLSRILRLFQVDLVASDRCIQNQRPIASAGLEIISDVYEVLLGFFVFSLPYVCLCPSQHLFGQLCLFIGHFLCLLHLCLKIRSLFYAQGFLLLRATLYLNLLILQHQSLHIPDLPFLHLFADSIPKNLLLGLKKVARQGNRCHVLGQLGKSFIYLVNR